MPEDFLISYWRSLTVTEKEALNEKEAVFLEALRKFRQVGRFHWEALIDRENHILLALVDSRTESLLSCYGKDEICGLDDHKVFGHLFSGERTPIARGASPRFQLFQSNEYYCEALDVRQTGTVDVGFQFGQAAPLERKPVIEMRLTRQPTINAMGVGHGLISDAFSAAITITDVSRSGEWWMAQATIDLREDQPQT